MKDPKRVLIIGGGFAGLTAAIELAKAGRVSVELMDENPAFLDVLALHKTHSCSLASLRTPYSDLSRRFGFVFTKRRLANEEILALLQSPAPSASDEPIVAGDQGYHSVILASGAQSLHFTDIQHENFWNLERLKKIELSKALQGALQTKAKDKAIDPLRIGVIGGGATGVQYAFEIAAYLKGKRIPCHLELFTTETSLLAEFPSEFGSYAHRAAAKAGIKIHYMTFVKKIKRDGLVVLRPDGSEKKHERDLIFNFAGVGGRPGLFSCNAFGEILQEEIRREPPSSREKSGDPPDLPPLRKGLYAAGDNSHFSGTGLNSQSAQAAVRKGRTVAAHILSRLARQTPKPYSYTALGYFVSLGPGDGIGWMLDQSVITTGLAAYAIKESIEQQFRLYLRGVDSYL